LERHFDIVANDKNVNRRSIKGSRAEAIPTQQIALFWQTHGLFCKFVPWFISAFLKTKRAHFKLIETATNNTNTKEKIMTKLEMKGDWNITKGKLKQKWASLTDNDLDYSEGKHDELIGRIQKRTGQSREAIEKAIRDLETV
jgi:uncharacterized protein YjbJ (UPF0337 family)